MVCRGLQIHCRFGDQQLADAREWLLIGLSLWVLLFILLQVALSANQHGWHGYVHYVCILIDWPGLYPGTSLLLWLGTRSRHLEDANADT